MARPEPRGSSEIPGYSSSGQLLLESLLKCLCHVRASKLVPGALDSLRLVPFRVFVWAAIHVHPYAVANLQIDRCSRCKGSRPADAHVPLPSAA